MVDVGRRGSSTRATRRLYRQYCAACHGLDRRGAPQQNVPPARRTSLRALSKADVVALHRKGKGVMPSLRVPLGPTTGRRSRRSCSASASGRPRRSAGSGDARHAVHPHRLQPLPRSRRLPGGEAAVGNAQRDRPEPGEIDWQVPLGELPELTRRGDPADRHRELRRPGRHGRRPRLHRRDEGREVPRLRQEDGQGALGDGPARRAATRRPRPTGERQAVRRHRLRRRQDGNEVGRFVRGLRPSRLKATEAPRKRHPEGPLWLIGPKDLAPGAAGGQILRADGRAARAQNDGGDGWKSCPRSE